MWRPIIVIASLWALSAAQADIARAEEHKPPGFYSIPPEWDAAKGAASIRRPNWRRYPTASDFASVYPKAAYARGLAGAAMLTCTVGSKGSLKDCVVVGELPQGLGFAYATIQLSKFFRVADSDLDGAPTAGGTVAVIVRFATS